MKNVSEKNRILILFAHPALEKSRINIKLISGLETLEYVTLNDLYEQYPRFDIDVTREQNLLLQHDIIIFHHPFFWYSTPAILKEWQDLVLEHGWAYGHGGDKLKGKILFNVITTGGREEAYQKDGYNRFTIRELLTPIEQTSNLCGMRFLPPFVVHGSLRMQPETIAEHAENYKAMLKAMVENRFDLKKAAKEHRINREISTLITETEVS